jgi:drug/metabolite transporter (DMT)-like permease
VTAPAAGTDRKAWTAFVAICVIWGTTYLAIKVGLETIPPLLLGGLRYLMAAVMMLVVLRAQGRRLPPRSTWPTQAVLGFLMLSLGNGGVVTGERFLTSGMTAVLVATTPFWMVAMDALLPGRRALSVRQFIGLLLGFSGIVLLVWNDIGASEGVWAGVIAVQVACLGWSAASAYTKRHTSSADVIGVATLQMLFGGAFMTLGGLVTGEAGRLSFSPTTLAALLYLAVLGSVVAFVCYSYALKHLPIAVISLYTYVNPVIAVALGAVLLGEPFGRRQVFAALVIATGMVVVRPGAAPEGDVA